MLTPALINIHANYHVGTVRVLCLSRFEVSLHAKRPNFAKLLRPNLANNIEIKSFACILKVHEEAETFTRPMNVIAFWGCLKTEVHIVLGLRDFLQSAGFSQLGQHDTLIKMLSNFLLILECVI